MSGAGAPSIVVDGSGLRVTVVAASWHTEVMDGLLAGARRALEAANVSHVTVVRVPGRSSCRWRRRGRWSTARTRWWRWGW